ncbi:MAG: AEC family transporter [bacterium]|nr:AEC family transporter [bacterium]
MQAFLNAVQAATMVFSIIGVGWLVANRFPRAIANADGAFWKQLASLVYHICIPALIIDMLATAAWERAYVWYIVGTILATVATIVTSITASAIGGLPSPERTTVAAIAHHPNCVFLGFPLALAVFGPSAMPLAVLFAIVEYPITTLTSIAILNRGRHSGADALRIVARHMRADPIVWSTAIGATLALTGIDIPPIVQTPLHWLREVASPLALLTVGARLVFRSTPQSRRAIVLTTALKLVVAPMVAYGIATMIGLPPLERGMLALLIGTPVAISTILLVEQHDGDSVLTANAITVTTIASLLTTSITAALVR